MRRSIGFLLLLLATPLAATPPSASPAYRRDKGAAPKAVAPATPRTPAGLVARRAAQAQAHAQAQAKPRTDSPAEIHVAAYQAGRTSAEAVVRIDGRREAYRVGFWEGQRAAFADPAVGGWERADGLRAGRLDPAALDYGAGEGERAAYAAAPEAARVLVERQFSDLSWRPVRSPRAASIPFHAAFAATVPPTLDVVFAEVPLASRAVDPFHGWAWTPSRLNGADTWTQFRDADWQTVDRGFAWWGSSPSHAASWRRLDGPAARQSFRAAFDEGFEDALEVVSFDPLEEAHADGFEDGWHHGAAVRGEWAWRQGYAEGFDRAVAFSAELAYGRVYPRAFAGAYDDEFQGWMTTSRPAILAATLRDANDDGVFQPGEAVEVAWTVANLGGAPGRFTVALDGAPLRTGTSTTVDVAARGSVEGARPVVATLRRQTAAPSDETLVLDVAGVKRGLPLRVSFPVEFTGAIGYRSLPLKRSGSVAFEIENRSRRAVDGIEVSLDSGGRRAIGRLEPGERAEASFDLDDLRPLDLLSGSVEVEARAFARGEPWDRRSARFPELATDLGSSALVDYLVELGHGRDADPAEVAAARGLLARRVAADWDVARHGDGNPYKDDVQDGGTRTALAELVSAFEKDRRTLSRSAAFQGLGDEIAAQVEELPGANPLLRRWARKLVERL